MTRIGVDVVDTSSDLMLGSLSGGARSAASSAIENTYKKVTLRLIPFLFICYVAAYLDRINVGFAQLQMKDALGFSDAVYGLGAGIFFAGYVLFEVPSNLLLERIGARKTLMRIMVLWGLTSAGMMFVTSPAVFYVMRFMLGVFEAGFFPGMILYLTYWYPASRRGRVMALFLTAVAMAGVIGGPVSGWVIGQMHGLYGLDGWQWMFLVEGLPACFLGIVAFFYLDDRPDQAKWLSPAEKAIIEDQLERDRDVSPLSRDHSFGDAVRSLRVYAMALTWFAFICGVYVISFWLPMLIRDAGIGDPLWIGTLSAIPYGAAVVTMVTVSRHSDVAGERRWHAAGCAIVGALGLAVIAQADVGLPFALLLISVTTAAIFSLQPLFWAMATDYLGGTRAAAGTIGLINSLGLIGGFVSPSILGWVKVTTGSLANGLYVMALLLVAGAVITLRSRKSA
jgi:D-galactonate transporter